MDGFIDAQRKNLDLGKQSVYFKDLIGATDAAYRLAIEYVPPEGYTVAFGRFLLICHKSLLSAATLIAQAQPEDSAGITRRAIEAAKLALAIKLNDENGRRWLSYQDDRWVKRDLNEKPASFRLQLEGVRGDPLIDTLDKFLGILSDAHVHFTPEFYSSLDWEVRRNPDDSGEIHLNYFQRSPREVERHFILLAAVHGKILDAFDRCFDGRFRADEKVRAAVGEAWQIGKKLVDEYAARYGVSEESQVLTDDTPAPA